MMEARKRAYLQAMGFDVWVARPPAPLRDRLVVGPGQGSTLLVCPAPEDSATKLAADIVRSIGGDPAWAWPDPGGDPGNPDLEQAVAAGMFTRVIVFGDDTAARLFGGERPEVLGSSSIRIAAGLDELATRGTAKLALWRLLSQAA